MAKFKGFVGSSYLFSNTQYDCQRTVNMYPEVDETGEGTDGEFAQLTSRQGKTLAVTLGGATVRGMWVTSDNRMFAVSGNQAYQITYDSITQVWTATPIGTLVTSLGYVSIADYAGVVVFVDNPNGYYYAPGQVTTISPHTGGSGYNVGDQLTIAAVGTQGVQFLCEVSSISAGGVITGLKIVWGGNGYTAGSYTNIPVAYYAGAGGLGATVNITVSAYNFGQIIDPDWPTNGAMQVNSIDGYFTFITKGTTFWFNSAPDGQVLPLQFGTFGFLNNKTGNSDPINGHLIVQRQVWLLGTQTGEVWGDTTSATSAFQRIPGPYLQQGCYSPSSVAVAEVPGGSIGFWVSQSPRGGAQVYCTDGLSSTKISTQVVDQQLQKYGDAMSYCTAFTYQEGGHIFYQVNPPTGNSSWVYDLTTSQLTTVPTWHERTWTNGLGQSSRDLADNQCYFMGFQLFGDYSSGNVYFLDANNKTDNGAPIYKERISPHVADEFDRVFYDMFQLKCRAGVGNTTTPSVNPLVILYISDDGGLTYSRGQSMPIGQLGQYVQLLRWNRQGYGRNRVFKITCTDNIQWDIMGADITVSVSKSPY